MKTIIVGGGIGGLATAVAFHRRGWEVEVLERAPEFTEVGAGLAIQPNGMRAVEALGLAEQLRAGGVADPPAGVRSRTGTWLIRFDADDLTRRFGSWVVVHRADLIDLLRAALPESALRPGTGVHRVLTDGTVTHDGGTSHADLVVGADGLHSVTRRTVWPHGPAPRYAGYTTWRLITPPRPVDGTAEYWGAGERLGLQPMPDGRIYCYVIANAPVGTRLGLDALRARFAGWHEPIPALLGSARGDALLQHDAYELPDLHSYVADRVALVGDAAHAMTPNLGQGACQALEDAATLAAVVDTMGVHDGLAAYDRLRRPRTQMIVRRSRQAGAPAHWTSAALTTLRDVALPLLPSSLFGRSLASTYGWSL